MKCKENRKGRTELPCIRCKTLTKRRYALFKKGITKAPELLPMCFKCKKKEPIRAI